MAAGRTIYAVVYVNSYNKSHTCACFATERAAAACVLLQVMENRTYSSVDCDIHGDDCEQCVIDIFDAAIKNGALNTEMLGALSLHFDSWCGDTWFWSITNHVV